MNNIEVICACTDLGVHINGTDKGPLEIIKKLNFKNHIIKKDDIVKSKDLNDLRKNEKSINNFTKKTFRCANKILESNKIPILLGGDHTVAIGSALASQKFNKNIGIIWIDAHGDYNTFETTKSGNIHGLPLAAITGYKCKELTSFITNNFINPKNCVVVGARSIDPWEIGNMTNAGVTIFTTEDIKNEGAESVMRKAIDIACNNTNGIHISYDLDVIDPIIAPGVSVPEDNGINLEEAYEIADIINKNKDLIKSFDLVELNPTFDIDNKTRDIAINIIKRVTKN